MSEFACTKNFGWLNGRSKQEVIIGDNPDARIAGFWCKARVIHNWPSQWSSRYRRGYIEFKNGMKFDLATETINGARAYIFKCVTEIEILYRRQVAENRIMQAIGKISGDDCRATADLIIGQTGLKRGWWSREDLARLIASCLKALSLREGEQLADLLWFAPTDAQRLESAKKAA